MGKPTIAELEQIMEDAADQAVTINPDGSISVEIDPRVTDLTTQLAERDAEIATLRARVEELENRRKGGCRSNFVLPGNRSIVCGNRVFCGQECFDRMKAFRAPPADTGEEGKG